MEAVRVKEKQEDTRTDTYQIVLTRRGSLEVVKVMAEVEGYAKASQAANWIRRRLKHAKRFRQQRKLYDIDITKNDRFISWVIERK
jgi:hypothetical protein